MAGNANSGRRPKPTALKLLQGNPGKRRLNEQEPKPPAGEALRPAWLSVAACVVWEELAPIAKAMGTLTTADVSAFAKLCELESSARANSQLKDTEGFNAREERDTANVLRPYYEKFGLEPVGRARIRVPRADAPRSKWDGLAG